MITDPIQVRACLLDALQVDLIGPSGPLGDPREVLPQAPSRWYLTGFLVPTDADEDQRFDPNSDDEVDQAPAVATIDENQIPRQEAITQSYLSSSTMNKNPSDTTFSKHHPIDETKEIFPQQNDYSDDLGSRTGGVSDVKSVRVSIG